MLQGFLEQNYREQKPPSQILPFLVAALVCDVAAEDPNTGKENLIGIFDHMRSGAFPAERQMSLYIKLTDAEGYYPLEVECVYVKDNTVLAKVEGGFEVEDRTVSVSFVMDFPPLPIPHPGRYEFRIKASGMFLGNAFIDVSQV